MLPAQSEKTDPIETRGVKLYNSRQQENNALSNRFSLI